MRASDPLPPRVARLHRILLVIVVAVLLTFTLGALVLFVAGPSPREMGRAASYLLLGTSAVLVLTFVVTYTVLRVLQRRRGGLDANLERGL